MNVDELRKQFERSPEEIARVNAKIEADKKRKAEIEESNKLQRFRNYIDSLEPRYKDASFENFIIRKDGGLAKEKAQIETLKGGLLFGTNGNGKTHLGYAACRRIVENGGSAKLIRAFNFFTEIKECYSGNQSINQVISKYANLDYLAIDECDKTRGTKDEFINIVELINRRYDKMLPTLIISNHLELKDIEEVFTPSCTDKIKEGGEIEMKYGSTRSKEFQDRLKERQSVQKS